MNFCVMDKDCAVYDEDYGVGGMAYRNPLCQACRDAIRGTLNQLRYDYVDLTQLLPPADGRNEVGKIFRPKPESKPNLNMAALTLRGEIAYTVAVVANAVRVSMGSTRRTPVVLPVREGYGLDHDSRWLAEHTDELAQLGTTELWLHDDEERSVHDGPGLVLLLRNLHAQARRMCGTAPKVLNLPGQCPICRLGGFRRHDDNPEQIWCANCKRRFTSAEYGRAVRLQWPMRNPTE